MGFLNNLLHGPAVLAMKNAEPETPTIMDSMPEAISWPTDAEFAGYANGMYCREYAVRVVVDFISRQLASLPLKVYRKNADGDAEEVRDGALAKLIRHPSDLPGMSRYRFYATLIRDMLLEDRWLCTLGSNRAGDGNTLRRIPPDGYSLTANGFGELTGVTISSVAENKGGTYRLPDPRIVLDIGYIDGLNLGDPITDVLRPLLAEARAMAKYRKSIVENGYQIPAYVYRPKEMPWESQADYDDFTQGLRNYVAGGGMAGTWSPIDLNIFRGEAWQWDLYANPTGSTAPAPATPAPVQPSTPPANTNTGGISHVMQWGETIWGLAVAYDAWPLSAWHTPSGDINRYYVGDVVTYGGGTAPASSGGVSKVLQWGDTVWDFATSHGYSVSQCSVPSGDINVYYVGDVVTCR